MALLSKADIYRCAIRLIERHGSAAEIACMLRADPTLQGDDGTLRSVLHAIAELRVPGRHVH